jgi:hypothetical protein
LTLVVFRSGKRGLKFDLAVIAVLQMAALLYGLNVISAARPAFLVFTVDRLVAVSANQLDDADLKLAPAGFDRAPWSGPRMAFAHMPEDRDTAEAIMFTALRGKDLEKYPQHYQDYSANAAAVVARAKPLALLAARDAAASAKVQRLVARSGVAESELGWLPLVARSKDIVAVVRRTDAAIVGYLDLDPWRGKAP